MYTKVINWTTESLRHHLNMKDSDMQKEEARTGKWGKNQARSLFFPYFDRKPLPFQPLAVRGTKQRSPTSLSAVVKSGTQTPQCLWPGCILHNYSICRRSLHCRIKLISVLRNEIGSTEKPPWQSEWQAMESRGASGCERGQRQARGASHQGKTATTVTQSSAQHQTNLPISTDHLTVPRRIPDKETECCGHICILGSLWTRRHLDCMPHMRAFCTIQVS